LVIPVTQPSPAAPDVVCIGSAALDMLLAVGRLPEADGRVPADDGMLAGGGPAATAAVALARLGARVELVARVASDLPGRLIREQLADEGVGVRWLASGGDTGRSALSAGLIQGGDPPTRSLVALPARPPLSIDDLGPTALEVCRRATWLHVDHAGWPLVPGIRAAGIGTPVSVDGGNPIEGLDLRLVDLYVPSLVELRRWSGALDTETTLRRALEAGALAVVATQGADGAAYLGGPAPDGPWPADRAVTTDHAARWRIDVPGYPVEARSTLGAGDVYHGALLAALVRGATIASAMTEASAAAALSCLALDGRSAIPDRPHLMAALDAWSPVPSHARRTDA
jgi:sugar/nucleoside kinase (ribokinase family)